MQNYIYMCTELQILRTSCEINNVAICAKSNAPIIAISAALQSLALVTIIAAESGIEFRKQCELWKLHEPLKTHAHPLTTTPALIFAVTAAMPQQRRVSPLPLFPPASRTKRMFHLRMPLLQVNKCRRYTDSRR